MPGNAPIALEHVRLTYDGGVTWALDDVSCAVAPGERVCVLGANGSGKSTLAGVMGGILAPDEGEVSLMGRRVYSTDAGADGDAYRAARPSIGLVFQDPEDQIITTVVEDDVAFGPENLGLSPAEIEARVRRELRRVAMQDFARADPTRLSGGQQQRVAIAGVLAMEPRVLVLDEPGALLDVRGRRAIMRVLRRLQDAGTTIVHVTHFVEEALEADRVVIMERGRIAVQGTPGEVFADAGRLEALRLELPFAFSLAAELGRRGIPVDASVPHEELVAGLARVAHGADVPNPEEQQVSRAETPAIRVANVSYAYDERPVLDRVSLEVASGELVAVVGQTGSGKSTLARVVCALATPDAGNAEVCGIPTTDRRRRSELRAAVGYVMQKPERQLFAPTVFEDVAFGPGNMGLSAEDVRLRTEQALDLLGIAHLAERSPFQLSGGQQRLAALAGILAMGPRVLVMDEPTSALDPRGREELRRLVSSLHGAGTSILMVTHSMDDAALLADRIVVLDRGHVVAEGTPREVFANGDDLVSRGLGVPAALELAHELEAAGSPKLGEPLTLAQLADAIAGRWQPWRSA